MLIDLWQTLKQFSQFSINEYFIVLNLHQLLSNINTTIDNLSHTHGIISHNDLHKQFLEFNFPSGFIIEFMESFQICKQVTVSGLKDMHKEIRASRQSLTIVSSFRTLSHESMHNFSREDISGQRKQSQVSSRPSPSGSTLSIEDHKDGASSPHPGLSCLRPWWNSSHEKLGPYCFFPSLIE